MNLFTKFEQNVLNEFCENDVAKQVIPEYEEKYEYLPQTLNNPVKDFFYWIKGEIYDLQALNDCFLGRERLIKRKAKLENKKKNDQSTLDKLSQGKKTLGTIFKGESAKQVTMTNLSNSIATAERDIELYDKILAMVESYIGKNVIPEFKEQKEKFYYKI
eukprot:CAMPEP_0205802994 /NCGR_PEP_ID=MMETSP0205-20121125/5505_1 /ASSEMBLY_ACC=CAM_ASM_000278 /TAXON_ID=36767 /ORGANISM="Euplotes focardii, Strain TN1" /LENGTH=159 /DNA_ID=CAMNT_0053070343 /DNA_START=139 /DNA_END=618 /DNA_ORIENTATION=+